MKDDLSDLLIGVLIKGVVVDSGPYPYRQRVIRATRTSGSIVIHASRSIILILLLSYFIPRRLGLTKII